MQKKVDVLVLVFDVRRTEDHAVLEAFVQFKDDVGLQLSTIKEATSVKFRSD